MFASPGEDHPGLDRDGQHRIDLASDLPKEPAQRLPTLAVGTPVDDVERQEEIPILDALEQSGEARLVALSCRLLLTPQRERRVMVLDHHQEIAVVTERRQEVSGQGRSPALVLERTGTDSCEATLVEAGPFRPV
jgi:hypothetical protein